MESFIRTLHLSSTLFMQSVVGVDNGPKVHFAIAQHTRDKPPSWVVEPYKSLTEPDDQVQHILEQLRRVSMDKRKEYECGNGSLQRDENQKSPRCCLESTYHLSELPPSLSRTRIRATPPIR